MKRLWFARKTYGFGWVPVTWQGWLVTGLYCANIAMAATLIHPPTHPFLFFLWMSTTTLLFIAVCYRTGEPPRWQWGKRASLR